MKTLQFAKCECLLNDFCVIQSGANVRWTASRVRAICNRRSGIGADGLIVLRLVGKARYDFRLFNSDGTGAEWSGNGVRCAAALMAQKAKSTTATFLTAVGTINTTMKRNNAGAFTVTYDRPVPPVVTLPVAAKLISPRKRTRVLSVDAGNPHWVYIVPDFEFNWQAVGDKCQAAAHDTHGVNVEFVQIDSPRRITLRLFERGVGPTPSSGSGALAAFAACHHAGYVGRSVVADAPGGLQRLRFLPNSEQVGMTARAHVVYSGEYKLA